MDCFVDNTILKYDPVSRTTSNNDGVEVRVPGFGNTTETVERLDKWPLGRIYSVYFARVVESLVSTH